MRDGFPILIRLKGKTRLLVFFKRQALMSVKLNNKYSRLVLGISSLVAALFGSIAQAGKIDVNQASAQTLATVKGIGAVTAERIVVERARGSYESMDHLSERLPGIGPKRLAKLKTAGLCAGSAQKSCASPSPVRAARAGRAERSKRTIHDDSEGVTPSLIQLP